MSGGSWPARVGRFLLLALPPVFAAMWVGATEIGGTFSPWWPGMVDLEVYRRTALLMFEGADFYSAEATRGGLPFIYPPFAALLSAPLAIGGWEPVTIAFILLNLALIAIILRRFGYRGIVCSALVVLVVWFTDPFRKTIGFGQVNIILLALCLLDLMPRPGRPRRIPEGVLIGIAAAIKLTPLVFTLYLLLTRRVRAAVVSLISMAVATGIGFIFLPGPSITYWGRLARGSSGIDVGMKFASNQSVIGNYVRWFRPAENAGIPLPGLVIAAGMLLLGLVAAVLWHRRGQATLGLCLAAFAGLIASPISWNHHFVWIVPLALICLQHRELPGSLRWLAGALVVWLAYAPFRVLAPDVELDYPFAIKLIDTGGLFLTVALFVLAIITATRTPLREPDATSNIERRHTATP